MFFKKKNIIYKNHLKKSNNFYECRPFIQLKDQLVYSNCTLSFENEFLMIYKNVKKEYSITINLISNLDEFKKSDLLIDETSNFKKITLYIVNNNLPDSISFAHSKGICDKDSYEMVLLYNDEAKVLEEYVELKKNKTSYFMYLDVLFLYLGCKDNEEDM